MYNKVDVSVILIKICLTHLSSKPEKDRRKDSIQLCWGLPEYLFLSRTQSRTYFLRHALLHKWLFIFHFGLLCKEDLILLSPLWEIPGVHMELYTDTCIYAAQKWILHIAALSLSYVESECAQVFSNTQVKVLCFPPQKS